MHDRRLSVWLGISLAITPTIAGQSHAQAPKEQAELARQAKNILTANCHRCHGQDGAAEGGFNFLLDRDKLIGRKAVVPSSPAQSRLFKRVASGAMPPEDEKPRPTEAEVNVLKKWIEAGAPDFNPPPPRRDFVSADATLKAIRKDLESLEEFDRQFTRYFTLTHLHNAGLSEEQLQTYRLALSKLANSLSWGRRVVTPSPIDPAKTVFRIDLRSYGWNEKVWDRVVAAHPYGIIYDSDVQRSCSAMTKCRLPFIRGDWFVAAAAKPPLYHDVLQLPKTDKELERQLRVDVAESIRQRQVIRAGFNSSGVSQNNRLLERHESAHGGYWKSYDFGGNAGPQNLFAHPMGPGGRNGFQADGGEIIFSLPNGLQGYLLVDSKGNRIEKGPTSIVSDPKRPDRAVVNGLSCMSCHSQGIIEKADEVRGHVIANPQSFSKGEAESILAIYPPDKKLKGAFKEDADRFARAVEKSGGKLDRNGRIIGTDPVVALAVLFEQDIDMKLAAAEVGLPVAAFAKALERSPNLSRALGQLKADSGSVKRDAFVGTFRGIVSELELGAYVNPNAQAKGTSEASVSRFAGRWRVHATEGTFFMTLNSSFDAQRTNDPRANGKWEIVGDEARITWSDGWRNILQPGKETIIAFKPGTGWGGAPTSKVRAVKEPAEKPATENQPATAPEDSPFVGRWKLVNDKGVTSAYLTVTKSFSAKRDHAPAPGNWEVVGKDARFTWADGFRDIMRLEDGKITYIGLGKAKSWDSPPTLRLQAVRIP